MTHLRHQATIFSLIEIDQLGGFLLGCFRASTRLPIGLITQACGFKNVGSIETPDSRYSESSSSDGTRKSRARRRIKPCVNATKPCFHLSTFPIAPRPPQPNLSPATTPVPHRKARSSSIFPYHSPSRQKSLRRSSNLIAKRPTTVNCTISAATLRTPPNLLFIFSTRAIQAARGVRTDIVWRRRNILSLPVWSRRRAAEETCRHLFTASPAARGGRAAHATRNPPSPLRPDRVRPASRA